MKVLWLIVAGAAVIELSHGLFVPRLKALPPAPAGWNLVEQRTLDLAGLERYVRCAEDQGKIQDRKMPSTSC